MWKRIRGAGLAYGASIRADMRRGQVVFKVYRSPNGFAAWNEAKKIVSEIVSGEVSPETDLLARALVCKIIPFWLCWTGVMVDCD